MPVLSLCPRCRAVMPASNALTPCRKCGERVIPAQRKMCFRCGSDITNAKRVKDTAGEYYCAPCWDEMGAAERPKRCACSGCGRTFNFEHLSPDAGGAYVCPPCLERNDDPNRLLAAAAAVEDVERPAPSPRAGQVVDPYDAQRSAELLRLGVIWSIVFAAIVTALLTIAVRMTAG